MRRRQAKLTVETLALPVRIAGGRGLWCMSKLDAIGERARIDLVVPTGRDDSDLFLWEHADRIARTALLIARFPEVARQKPDELATVATALYHEAAWVQRVQGHEVMRMEILLRAAGDDHRELGASIMRKSLKGLLPADSLERAARAIRSLDHRDIDTIEAIIVSDAKNLDEFGVLSLWSTIRRGAIEGQTVQAVIDRWHRRTEYHFYSARLTDSFRLQSVRDLARKRLDALQRVMREIEEQHTGSDVSGG